MASVDVPIDTPSQPRTSRGAWSERYVRIEDVVATTEDGSRRMSDTSHEMYFLS